MAKAVRFYGSFLNISNVEYSVNILQEDFTGEAQEVFFSANEPVSIEWKSTYKYEPIRSSAVTLKLLSETDRQFVDMYSIAVGRIRLDIYREGTLIWSGTLDTEVYSEPYSRNKNYFVELTFSDFGIWERLKYNLSGIQTLFDILSNALDRSNIIYNSINQQYISTYIDSQTKATLEALCQRSENFYDEDNEASSLKDVIKGILQPLNYCIIQINGIIYIYDYNSLYNNAQKRTIEWRSDNQTLETDTVYNNVKITFSPYSNATIISSNIEYTAEYATEDINKTSDPVADGSSIYYSFYVDYDESNKVGSDWDNTYLSFTLFLSDTGGTGIAEKLTGTRYFHILPLLGASESDGLAYSFYTGGHGSLSSGFPERKLLSPSNKRQVVLMKTDRAFIPKIEDSSKYYLRLSIDMLLDPRYNPFSDAGDGNEQGNYNNFKEYIGYMMVPVTVTLYDGDGNALMHYSNEDVAKSSTLRGCLAYTKGTWKTGAATYGSCWLEWYNTDDRSKDTGVLGWQKNRHNIGLTKEDMYKSFAAMDDGQFIPYPSQGGYIEVCVYEGIWLYDYGEQVFGEATLADSKGLYDKIRWLLYKAPELTVVNNNIIFDDAESDDIEYNSYINKDAKDSLSIDTICGSLVKECPTAKGVYFNSSTSEEIKTLTRAGRTTQIEDLLIGSIYSQYANRKIKLTGTTSLLSSSGFGLYNETMQDDKVFLCTKNIESIREGISDAEFVELRPDEYTEQS